MKPLRQALPSTGMPHCCGTVFVCVEKNNSLCFTFGFDLSASLNLARPNQVENEVLVQCHIPICVEVCVIGVYYIDSYVIPAVIG